MKLPKQKNINFGLRFWRIIGHQDWIRLGLRERLIRFFKNPKTVGSFEFETDFFGVKYHGTLDNLIDWRVFFLGGHEKQELYLLKDITDKDSIVLDVGANIGQHSLFLSKFCGEIHAFEPYKRVSSLFKKKVHLNGIDNIYLHEVALGKDEDQLEFYVPEGENWGVGTLVPNKELAVIKKREMVSVVNADEYISSLGLSSVDLIKIDVEGFEKNVLIGLNNTLKLNRPIVFMEFSTETKNKFYNLNEFISLFPEDYIVSRIVSNKPFLWIFNKSKYFIEKFDFKQSNCNIIVYPKEKAMSI